MKTSGVILIFLAGLIWGVVVAPATADTIYIQYDGNGDAPTIQAGIDQANGGDTVLLGSGTFSGPGNYDIDFLGKAITVQSESGAAATIIDCGQNGRGFIFQNGEGLSSVLMGVTIQNGDAGIFGKGGGHPVRELIALDYR